MRQGKSAESKQKQTEKATVLVTFCIAHEIVETGKRNKTHVK